MKEYRIHTRTVKIITTLGGYIKDTITEVGPLPGHEDGAGIGMRMTSNAERGLDAIRQESLHELGFR